MKLVWVLSLLIMTEKVLADALTREQLSELHQIRTEIKSAVFDRARFQQDIIKSKLDIENQKLEIAKNQTEASEIKEKILSRIATLYKIKRAYPQGTWLSFAKQEDFLRKGYYLNYLNAQDKSLVEQFKNKTAVTSKLKDKVHSYMNRLVELQKENEKKFAELRSREIRQRELIRQIRETVRSQSMQTAEGENLDKKFFSELRGQLEKPLNGEMKGTFGILRDRKAKMTFLKTGLTLASNPGVEVRSVYDGEVLHTGILPGWGPTIIIDHGESYYSVYSQLKNLSVRPGDRVLAKQKLAEVSPLPYHKRYSESGLYFEIRHYSEPEDPRIWFKGAQQ